MHESPGRPPAVSVVMPVHNARPYLEYSVGSVLDQTFPDLELVILENGSSDGSGELLRTLAEHDSRIRLFREPGTLGRAGSSNLVVSHARADVIARMDADDVSHSTHLERQLEALRSRPDAVLAATLYEGIDGAGHGIRPRDRSRLLRKGTESPFPHGSCTFRRGAFERVGGYREEHEGWEDLDFLQRLGQIGALLVLPWALYYVRHHSDSAHRGMSTERFVSVATTKGQVLARRFPDAARSPDDRTIDALYEREAEQLWSGRRPTLLRQLTARGLAPRLGRRAWLLVWAGWGCLSPGSLRLALRLRTWARDRTAGRNLNDREVVEWRYG
jgi:glycosyltransferase involved in cell wall biosynthesis